MSTATATEKRRRRVVFLADSLTRRIDSYAGGQGLGRADIVELACKTYLESVERRDRKPKSKGSN